MHAQIKIVMDTPAFSEKEGREELATVLRECASMVNTGLREFSLSDADGKVVGHFHIVGRPRRFAR